MISILLALCEGNALVNSLDKGSLMQSWDVFCCCCCQPEKKLLKKQVRCRWFETSLGSVNITVMWLPWVDGFDTNAQYYHNFSCHLWWGTKLKSFLIRKTKIKLSYIVIPWLLMTWWQCQVQHKENTRIFNIFMRTAYFNAPGTWCSAFVPFSKHSLMNKSNHPISSTQHNGIRNHLIDGLVEERRNSIATALELP